MAIKLSALSITSLKKRYIFSRVPPEMNSLFLSMKLKVFFSLVSYIPILPSLVFKCLKRPLLISSNKLLLSFFNSSVIFEFRKRFSTVFKLALNLLRCSNAFSLLLNAPLMVKTKGKIIAILIRVKSML